MEAVKIKAYDQLQVSTPRSLIVLLRTLNPGRRIPSTTMAMTKIMGPTVGAIPAQRAHGAMSPQFWSGLYATLDSL